MIHTIWKWPGFVLLAEEALGSVGDNSVFYINCVKNCAKNICHGGKHEIFQTSILGFGFSLWSCLENCEYDCQWKTVEAFQDRNWPVPQFKGKWPFLRLFGFQEPASVFFSILQFFITLKLILLFRKKVPKSAAFYNIWNIYGLVELNTWLWSTIYHARDFDFTERMDYMSAFLFVMYSFYTMGLRYLSTALNIKTILWSVFCMFLGLNHLAYLWLYNFDYGYNMTVNCILGGLTVIGWFIWTFLNFPTQFFVWKIFAFASLVTGTTLLELMDFPPFLWIFDAHALWHGSTIICNIFFFLFIIDDCNYLHYHYLKNSNFISKGK